MQDCVFTLGKCGGSLWFVSWPVKRTDSEMTSLNSNCSCPLAGRVKVRLSWGKVLTLSEPQLSFSLLYMNDRGSYLMGSL